MANQTPRNEMAERLADTVGHARFAKSYSGAMAHFGGRGGADEKERLMAWRQARAAPQRAPAEEPPPEGFRGEGLPRS
ncbi:hypothetical protein EJV46_20430 [Roseococcus sp. SYP-B2431]|uniref:hypothetical protein n=1 Tax=Roseococcus sp. SYP-B2431 TaxID=2496640 RepID=UPI00103D005B|nr:hypothetical protein [Roseococcus sp. SYP-B2431]TCH96350.1 hypothetical protein EJV46_20430 [Roseococcus sp. SYP-B2431]